MNHQAKAPITAGILCALSLGGCTGKVSLPKNASTSRSSAFTRQAPEGTRATSTIQTRSKWARTRVVEVMTTGTSMTRQGAVTDALVNAINQVNGVVLDEQTLALSLDAGFRTTSFRAARGRGKQAHRTNWTSLCSGAYAKFMEEETHGAIDSYTVLSLARSKDGSWVAHVQASIAKFVRPQEALRRSIAVLAPTILQNGVSIDGVHSGAKQADAVITQGIVNGLTSTQKFTILDREHLGAQNAELGAIRAGEASVQDYALLGKRLVADYVLVTNIDKLKYQVEATHFLDSHRVIQRGSGIVSAFYELIDPVTSQVVATGTITRRLTPRAMRRYGSTGTDRGKIQALSTFTGEEIANSIADTLYPVMIVDATGNDVVIAEGAGALRIGERYRVFKYGRTVKDPYTGESLGREETLCCIVQISRTTSTLAYGAISGLAQPFQTLFQPDTFVLGHSLKTSQRNRGKAAVNSIQKMIKQQNSVFGSN